MWFATGIMLMYVGFPKLTQAERLSQLEDLTPACCMSLNTVLAKQDFEALPQSIQAVTVGERPIYKFGFDTAYKRADARTGEPLPDVGKQEALQLAAHVIPGAAGRYDGLVVEDIWTHTQRFAKHRPYHRIEMNDPANTLLYVSSRTGEVVRDAPLSERRWAYASAWLHWLYMFRTQKSSDPMWQWVVSISCIVGIILAGTGIWIGISRWRFSGRYKSGRKTPYPKPLWRWHHIGGLLFAFITLTWLISGLASVNPFGIFDRQAVADKGAYSGDALRPDHFTLPPSAALARLAPSFVPRQLDWVSIGGDPYLIATDANNAVRVLPGADTSGNFRSGVSEASVRRGAEKLIPGAQVEKFEVLTHYDGQYYTRAEHTLRGDENRRLPVYRVSYSDPTQSIVYIDMHTGEIVMHLDRPERAYRWAFNFLHSWDWNPLVTTRPLWDIIMLALQAGGLVICVSGTILGWRRLKFTVNNRRKKKMAARMKSGNAA
tara:strand:+ start:17055 stop:18521 length:1467 start_codon:yes stop_codon:yes gene_type:complete